MEVWQTILLAIGGNAVAVAALAWLARALLNNSLGKDLERHRATLALETQSATERLKHELGLVAQEHQISFSELQARRGNVIAEAYSLLAKAHWECASYVSNPDLTGKSSPQERYMATEQALADFYRYFNCNRIFLPDQTCSAIDQLMHDMRYQVGRMHGYMVYGPQTQNATVLNKQLEALSDASEHFNRIVPMARKALENDLRAIIGGPIADAADRNGSAKDKGKE